MPLIIHDPAHPVGRVVQDPVAMLDVGPTLLHYAGLPKPEALHGRSLLGGTDPDRAVMTVWNGAEAIRRGNYRLIRYADGQTQLFDITQDFWQQTNLGPDHPAHAPMMASLIATAQVHAHQSGLPSI